MERAERLAAPVFAEFRQRAEQVLRQRERAANERAGQKRPVLVSAELDHADGRVQIVQVEYVNMRVVDWIPEKHSDSFHR